MTDRQQITPPPELVHYWSRFQGDTNPEALWFHIANEAAQWGADRELEACRLEIIDGVGLSFIGDTNHRFELANNLHDARRPKPPSLKEQALARTKAMLNDPHRLLLKEERETLELNRRALEALPDD